MSDKNYSIALSHALLAGTSFWVIYRINGLNYVTGTFGLIALNSCLNVWKHGNPDYGDKVDDIVEHTEFATTLFATPGVNTELYLHYGWEWIYAIIHMIVPAIPMTLSLLGESVDYALVDASNAGNLISMIYISFTNSNDYGLVAAACYAVNHFVFKRQQFGEVPKEVMNNLGMCFYVYFAYKAFLSSFMPGMRLFA